MEEALRVTADDLLADARATFQVLVPRPILRPAEMTQAAATGPDEVLVQLRPVTIGTFHSIDHESRPR